jgi:hypothetical protein
MRGNGGGDRRFEDEQTEQLYRDILAQVRARIAEVRAEREPLAEVALGDDGGDVTRDAQGRLRTPDEIIARTLAEADAKRAEARRLNVEVEAREEALALNQRARAWARTARVIDGERVQ